MFNKLGKNRSSPYRLDGIANPSILFIANTRHVNRISLNKIGCFAC